MDFYLENDTEVEKVKENGFKVHYLDNKPYIILNDLLEVEKNSYLVYFTNYTPSTNLILFQESLDNLS